MPKLPEGFDKIDDWERLTEIARDETAQGAMSIHEKAAEAARNSPRVRDAARELHEGGATMQELNAAFIEEYNRQPVVTLHISDDTEGERTEVFTVGQFKGLSREGDIAAVAEMVKSGYTVKAGSETYGGGIVEIEVNPTFALQDGESIPLTDFIDSSLEPGRYFVVTGADVGEDWSGQELGELNAAVMEKDGLLLATREDQIRGDAALNVVEVTITPRGDGASFDPLELWTTTNSDGDYLGLQDLIRGLFLLAAITRLMDKGDIKRGATPLDEMQALVRQHTIKPRKQIDPNSKVANRITEAALYARAGALIDVSGRKEKGDVLTAVSLNYEGEGVSINKQLTQFDREVHNAVTTLFVAGNRNVTITQIWKQLSGSNDKPNKTQADALRESVDKQRFTRVVIDYTAEARGRDLQDMEGNPVTSFVIDDYFLNATKARIETANGREVEGYVINRAPALYEHSQTLGQVITYPAKLLDTSEAGQNTSENIVIKKYLLRRIGMLKGKSGARLSPRIKYTSVYKVAGYEGEGSPDKKQRKRINDYVLECMKIWQASGYISGFREYKEGRTRAGIEVFV